ncbi:MAG TPA: peptidoglycan DD-metalloendopeptidase family protein [Candidatus Limnocylindria bacterium]|nr:peptidoglycan DD-metalloendopeptidase family protein [Candidatus Limnocylindria bacterium]
MRRRSHLAIMVIALLMVGTSIVTTSSRDQAQAADPLADAKAQQQALEDTLSAQRAALAALKAKATTLGAKLNAAKAELASVTAEFNRVSGLLSEVQVQVAEITAHLADLRAQIARLDKQLQAVAIEILRQTDELHARESLLQEHLRSAYERSQTSLLELLLSADSLDAATNQVGYMLTVSDQDKQLADEIRDLRASLESQEEALREGRVEVAAARDVANEEAKLLAEREAELAAMQKELARLKAAAEQKRREQEAALNAALEARGDVAQQIEDSQKAFDAATKLVAKLQAEEDARRQAPSAFGFKWPELTFHVTQEWGPTRFVLEPPYTYKGVYYPHFHGGIDLANGCGTPVLAVGTGTVRASGQPLWPWDSGYGVVISHGSGVQSWYWHLKAVIVVRAGQVVSRGQVIGYEGNTGNSTGCHLHFAINDHGVWENPRVYLP